MSEDLPITLAVRLTGGIGFAGKQLRWLDAPHIPDDATVLVTTMPCPHCGGKVTIPATAGQVRRCARDGEYVQVVFPHLGAATRERLITGRCGCLGRSETDEP